MWGIFFEFTFNSVYVNLRYTERYDRLFTAVVRQINKTIEVDGASNTNNKVIGVLDIYGFETLENNSFEQLYSTSQLTTSLPLFQNGAKKS